MGVVVGVVLCGAGVYYWTTRKGRKLHSTVKRHLEVDSRSGRNATSIEGVELQSISNKPNRPKRPERPNSMVWQSFADDDGKRLL